MEGLVGTILVFVVVNRGALAGILTGTGTRTVTATTELLCSLSLLTFPSVFL